MRPTLSELREAALIPARANRVLQLVLIALLLIAIRIWHLTVVQHDARALEARRPQKRHVVERAERGTIVDRFGVPLAVNSVRYNAAISYADIKEVPSVSFERDSKGKRVKRRPRAEHIAKLSELLAVELGMEKERIEDLIYSRAALFPNVPYVIKADLSEREYYRLKCLEREWLGMHAEKVAKRCYPLGRVAGEILGYMGPISREEYERVAGQIGELEGYLRERELGEDPPLPQGLSSPVAVQHRLTDLKERAYSISDFVGKSGIEARFDEVLRGYSGERVYQLDIYGNYLRELPGGREALPGGRVVLSISSELQQFAEELLIQHEGMREGRSRMVDPTTHQSKPLKQPWIKGGAIVVIEPNSGEVLAMASTPRFDPNDFIPSGDPALMCEKQRRVLQWLEVEGHLANLWDGKSSLFRERFSPQLGDFIEEEVDLSWESFIGLLLPTSSPIREALKRAQNLSAVIDIQRRAKELQESGALMEAIEGATLKIEAFNGIKSKEERLLFLDLCQLIVDERLIPDELLAALGTLSLSHYRESTCAALAVAQAAKALAKELFHTIGFRPWRESEGAAFLKARRLEEKLEKRYERPYLDYLDREEGRQFEALWAESGYLLAARLLSAEVDVPQELSPYAAELDLWREELRAGAHHALSWRGAYMTLQKVASGLSPDLLPAYLRSMRSYRELNRPLFGRYPALRSEGEVQLERDLAAAIVPRFGFGYGRSYAFRQAATQGSIFKIIPAYQALVERYLSLRREGREGEELNPLTIIDDPKRAARGWNMGLTEDGRPIPERYKGGKLIKTMKRNVGRIDLPAALEVSSNAYFGLLAVDHMETPEAINWAARAFSFGERTGIDLPGEFSGHLPTDLLTNRTGLYSYVIGQHTLTVTPLQTAVALATLANGGTRFKPKLVREIANEAPMRRPEALFSKRNFAFKEPLSLLGLSFPLFTGAEGDDSQVASREVGSVARSQVLMPDEIRRLLLEGLYQGVIGERGSARPTAARGYHDFPWMVRDYRDLQFQMVGKTSTAEAIERVDLDPEGGAKYNHIWFGGISFPPGEITMERGKPHFGKPELAIVVYLRYADYGKEAPPLAGEIVKKWREITAQAASSN